MSSSKIDSDTIKERKFLLPCKNVITVEKEICLVDQIFFGNSPFKKKEKLGNFVSIFQSFGEFLGSVKKNEFCETIKINPIEISGGTSLVLFFIFYLKLILFIFIFDNFFFLN